MKLLYTIAILLFIPILVYSKTKKNKNHNCEVCIKVIEDFSSHINSNPDAGSVDGVIKSLCSKYNRKSKEHRFCWYIGALPDSATNILNTIVDPIKNKVPSSKICQKLKAKDLEICALRYDKKSDDTNDAEPEKEKEKSSKKKVNLSKLKIRELKKLILELDPDRTDNDLCVGCTSKDDYISKVLEIHREDTGLHDEYEFLTNEGKFAYSFDSLKDTASAEEL